MDVDVYQRKSLFLVDDARQVGTDVLQLFEPDSAGAIGDGLNCGAAQDVDESASDAVGELEQVLDELPVDCRGRAPDGEEGEVPGDEPAQVVGFATDRELADEVGELLDFGWQHGGFDRVLGAEL